MEIEIKMKMKDVIYYYLFGIQVSGIVCGNVLLYIRKGGELSALLTIGSLIVVACSPLMSYFVYKLTKIVSDDQKVADNVSILGACSFIATTVNSMIEYKLFLKCIVIMAIAFITQRIGINLLNIRRKNR